MSEDLNNQGIKNCQSVIDALQWSISLRCLDIACSHDTIWFQSSTSLWHMEHVQHGISYPVKMKHGATYGSVQLASVLTSPSIKSQYWNTWVFPWGRRPACFVVMTLLLTVLLYLMPSFTSNTMPYPSTACEKAMTAGAISFYHIDRAENPAHILARGGATNSFGSYSRPPPLWKRRYQEYQCPWPLQGNHLLVRIIWHCKSSDQREVTNFKWVSYSIEPNVRSVFMCYLPAHLGCFFECQCLSQLPRLTRTIAQLHRPSSSWKGGFLTAPFAHIWLWWMTSHPGSMTDSTIMTVDLAAGQGVQQVP